MSEGTSLGGYAILGRAERVGLRYRYRALAHVQGREVTLGVIHRALSGDATFRERFFRDGPREGDVFGWTRATAARIRAK